MDVLATPEAWEQPELALEEEDALAAGLSTPLTTLEGTDAKTYDPSEWATPQWLFDRYDEVYRFTLDAAANGVNAKCHRFCVTPLEALRLLAEHGERALRPDGSLVLPDGRTAYTDGLAQDWAGERVWINCPYSPKGAIPPWCEKAGVDAQRGATVVMLLLADTSTSWYHDLVAPHAEVEFLRGRVRHVHPITGEVSPGAPKMGSLIAVYRPPLVIAPAPPVRLIAPLPRRRSSVTVTAPLGRGHVHVTLGTDDAGEPCEVFVRAGKCGSDVYAHTEALGRLVSAALQLPLAPGHRRIDVVAHLSEQLRGIGGQEERTVAHVLAEVLAETWLRRDAA